MMQDEWENKLTDQDQNMLVKNILPDHAKLTEYLRILFPMTGIIDKLFCNEFMLESLKLLKHGIFLYENGFFDCAFYSVRQSIENMNNMLFLSQCKERFAKWKAKEWFPSDSRVKSQLKQINVAYSEVKTIIPEVFNLYDELLEKANKYIHKQGFDTFYLSPWQHKRLMPKITELFTKFFKQSILLMIIMNIILDPLSLALSDPDIDARIPFDPLTENIPVSILEELFNQDIVEKIKKATFYKEFISCFMDKEKMNDATYAVIRYRVYKVEALSDIEKQVHLLNIWEILCFRILKAGIKVSHFYFENDFLGYFTSIEPSNHLKKYSSDQFDQYIKDDCDRNIKWNGMFISVYKVFNSYIILQHNEPFTSANLSVIQSIIDNL